MFWENILIIEDEKKPKLEINNKGHFILKLIDTEIVKVKEKEPWEEPVTVEHQGWTEVDLTKERRKVFDDKAEENKHEEEAKERTEKNKHEEDVKQLND